MMRSLLSTRSTNKNRHGGSADMDRNGPSTTTIQQQSVEQQQQVDPFSSWQSMLQQLQAFVKDHGHARVPEKWPTNPSLARWISYQRTKFRLGTLAQGQLEQLEALGMVWNPYQVDWEERYKDYCNRQQQQELDSSTSTTKAVSPTTDAADAGKKHLLLDRWIAGQRYQYRLYLQGKPSHMTLERIARLNQVKFEWEPHGAVWMNRYRELRNYHRGHGHCSVTRDSPELYRWIEANRYQYKKLMDGRRPCSMTDERIKLLEEIGFVWDAREAAWLERFRELQEFVQANGPGKMPPIKQHGPLWHWLRRQIKFHEQKNKGKHVALTDERIAKLQGLGFLVN